MTFFFCFPSGHRFLWRCHTGRTLNKQSSTGIWFKLFICPRSFKIEKPGQTASRHHPCRKYCVNQTWTNTSKIWTLFQSYMCYFQPCLLIYDRNSCVKEMNSILTYADNTEGRKYNLFPCHSYWFSSSSSPSLSSSSSSSLLFYAPGET